MPPDSVVQAVTFGFFVTSMICVSVSGQPKRSLDAKDGRSSPRSARRNNFFCWYPSYNDFDLYSDQKDNSTSIKCVSIKSDETKLNIHDLKEKINYLRADLEKARFPSNGTRDDDSVQSSRRRICVSVGGQPKHSTDAKHGRSSPRVFKLKVVCRCTDTDDDDSVQSSDEPMGDREDSSESRKSIKCNCSQSVIIDVQDLRSYLWANMLETRIHWNYIDDGDLVLYLDLICTGKHKSSTSSVSIKSDCSKCVINNVLDLRSSLCVDLPEACFCWNYTDDLVLYSDPVPRKRKNDRSKGQDNAKKTHSWLDFFASSVEEDVDADDSDLDQIKIKQRRPSLSMPWERCCSTDSPGLYPGCSTSNGVDWLEDFYCWKYGGDGDQTGNRDFSASVVSFRSDQSKDKIIDFKEERASFWAAWLNNLFHWSYTDDGDLVQSSELTGNKDDSASIVSFRSDQSKDKIIDFKEEQASFWSAWLNNLFHWSYTDDGDLVQSSELVPVKREDTPAPRVSFKSDRLKKPVKAKKIHSRAAWLIEFYHLKYAGYGGLVQSSDHLKRHEMRLPTTQEFAGGGGMETSLSRLPAAAFAALLTNILSATSARLRPA